VIPPGGLLALDASGSTGQITQFAFDVDGNGAYETKCGKGKAGAVYTKPGSYKVGVQITGAGGQKSTAQQTFTVAGPAVSPPTGAKGASPVNGTILGDCLADVGQTLPKPWLCPRTVIVGVAEATPPAVSPDACFKFTKVLGKVRYYLQGAAFGYVNGLQLWPSGGGGNLIIGATEKRVMLGGRLELHKDGYQLFVWGKKGPHSWNVAKPGIVGDVTLGGAGSFLGLDVPEMTRPVKLTSAKTAELAISLSLPYQFVDMASGGIALHFDNTDGLVIESFAAKFGGFALGPFGVKSLEVAYQREGTVDVWKGAIGFDFGDSTSAGGEIRFRNGSLDLLTIWLQKENPGFPIGCCIYIPYLQGTYETGQLKANAVISFGPSIGTPWGSFRAASVDPAELKISTHSVFVQVEGALRVVGKKVGTSYAWFGQKGFSFGGAMNESFKVAGIKVIEVGLIAEGSISFGGSWYAGGEGSVCIFEIDCAGGSLAISNNGAAGCLDTWIGLGGYVHWSGSFGYYEDCSWESTKDEAGAPALLSSGTLDAVDVKVPAGTSRRLFRIVGRMGVPRVVLAGPGGRRIEAASPVLAGSHAVVQIPHERTAYVVVRRPAAGTWRITPLPDSSAIVRVASAGPLPDRLVTGSVRGAGLQRIFEYELSRPRSFAVTFVERGQRVHRVIGKARARKGSIRFAPAEAGSRARRIEAVFEKDGLAARTEVVARYRVPPLRPLARPMLAVSRRGGTVVARWLPVSGASRYHALVTPGDGQTRFFRLAPSRTSVRVPVGLRAGATISVRALSAEGRPGRLARARLAPESSVRVLSARRGVVSVRCLGAAAGRCTLSMKVGSRTIGTGSARVAYGNAGLIRARIARSLRPGTRVTLVVSVPGEGARTLRVRLR
jgi:hypothetical protein